MTPNMTRGWVAYLAANLLQKSANCAFVGPPWPMMAPFQRA
jgi:hypothetical protein